jgi:RimJ/RimL family protein N-acetyltransferase
MHACEADPVSNALAGVKPRDRDAFMTHWQRVFADGRVIPRTILADGVVAGSIACFERDGEALIGYWIRRDYWGLGIATRALGLLLNEVQRRPLHARVSAGNAASIRILQRHGFIETGRSDEPETERYRAGPVIAYRLD